MDYFRPNIQSLVGYTPGEQPQHGKYIKLNTSENPYPSSDRVLQAIGAVTAERLALYPDPVSHAFRAAASGVLGVPEDWILCGNGSDELLNLLIRAFVGEGQAVRFPVPGYVLYPTLCDIQGARHDPVRYAEDWSLGESFTETDESVRLALLANPNNPSGTALEPKRVEELADQLACPLVVDEAYVDFADQSCLDLVKQRSDVVVTRTLSKSYALAGLRFGYLVAQPELIDRLMRMKDSYNCDTLSIVGATAAMSDQVWQRENRQMILNTRARMVSALESLGFEIPQSQANFLWCTHPTASLQQVYEGLKAERILVRFLAFSDWGDGLRISVGTEEQIDALLTLLPPLLDRAGG